ncbi:cytochrome c [Tardiphaga robiniae]|uniref:Cytochrome c n=1 Tax=Tardiphaga robiniae TaxID=943830 RepID=A0A7G6TYY7_9BRAD|nr:cytochrome c [Tardiphaga robiniae]QND71969.1 cytochrome c [Tardiphaga robiniae]
MTYRKHIVLAGFAALTFSLSGIDAAGAKPVNYQLPDDTAELKPGKNLEAVQNNCTACHSPDYIKTQPQGPAFKMSFWQAEVMKMIKVYGAPIDDADVGKIIEYLSENY